MYIKNLVFYLSSDVVFCSVHPVTFGSNNIIIHVSFKEYDLLVSKIWSIIQSKDIDYTKTQTHKRAI